MAFGLDHIGQEVLRGAKRGSRGKVRRREVAGPYRSQSSVPSVRRQATPHEHRSAAPRATAPRKSSAPRKSASPALDTTLESVLTRSERRSAAAAQRRVKATRIKQRTMKSFRATLRKSPVVLAPGEKPNASLKQIDPKAYDKAQRRYVEHLDENLGEPEDLTNVVLAASGAGDLANIVRVGLGAGAKEAASLAAETAAKQAAGSGVSAETKAGLKRAAEALKAAPKNAAKATKAAPRDLVDAAKAPAKSVKAIREAGAKETASAAAKGAARHPVRTTFDASAASPVPLPGRLDKRARAAAEGARRAVTEHPVETLETTARSLPAAITGPAALLEAAGLSAIHRDPGYLEKTAAEQAKGLGQIVGDTFSGDPKIAEKAFTKEGAGALFTPLPAVTRLKSYERARGVVREAANATRGELAKRSDWANRNLRHAPHGTEPPVFGFAARRGERKSAAQKHQDAYNPQRVSQGKHEKALTDAISKAPKGSHVALQTVAEYGIRDRHGAELVRRHGPGDKQLLKALDYMDAHPNLWDSKAFLAAVKAHERNVEALPASVVGKGERARLLPQGDLLRVPRPGMRVPHVRREGLGGAKTWPEVVSRLDALKRGHAENLRLAKRQLSIARSGVEQTLKARRRLKARVARLKGKPREAAEAELAAVEGAYKLAKRRRDEANEALKQVTVDGRKMAETRKEAVARSKATLKNEARYDSRLLHEYADEVEKARSDAGLARGIYTPHSAGEKGSGLENRFPTPVGRVEHMRRGGYALEDNLDRSLEGLVRGTRASRERAAGKVFGRDLAEEKLPFKLDGETRYIVRDSKEWRAITGRKSAENPNGGQFDVKSVGRLAIREVKNAIDDPFMTENQKSAALDALLRDAEEGKTKGSAPSLVLPRELIREARAQLQPEHTPITRMMNSFSRISNRAILGTNPAWAISQIAAEGIPLLMAKPSLVVKAPSLLRDMVRYRKEHPEEAAALEATAGAAPHSAPAVNTPLDQATPETFAQGARALTRGKAARTALSFASLRALGQFDRGRQNAYRSVLLAAEADKQFRSFHSSLTNLFDRQAALSRHFKTREDLWHWLSTDPKGKREAAKLGTYVDNIQGNWTAFTRFERAFAPFTIFYPFLRYSLRWTLWTFPRTHPITATLAYMLGQQNANQIEELIGGKPSSPLPYAFPVYTTPGGEKAVLPAGTRISPGQSSLTQAAATGNPAAVLSSANPFLGALVTGLTGTVPLTGEKSTLPRGYAALNQLLEMPAPVRLAGVKLGGESVAAQAFAKFDPHKLLRSLVLPMEPLSGGRLKEEEELARAFSKKYGSGHIPGPFDSARVQEVLFSGVKGNKVDRKGLKKLLADIHASEAAGDTVKSAEAPFYGDSGAFSPEQKKALEAIEEAWKTRPKGKVRRKGTGIGGTVAGGIGGPSASSSIGGVAVGGGIGGHPVGGPIGG